MLNASSMPAQESLGEASPQDVELAHVLEACLADIESGRAIDPARLVAEHPAIAERLQGCLITLNLVQHAAVGLGTGRPFNEPVAAAGRLGDFDIIREVGRGGMGVVYEAKQISLGRRVALKVLPFAATLDPRQLQRFSMEAQAAAMLHHAHIVPVYSVGCERGVHYYAMQYIEGQSLAQVIADLRLQIADVKNDPTPTGAARAGGGPPICNLQSEICNPTVVALTTERSAHSPGYFRAVARLGVQAAEALEHAHQLGVVHRDIKPANLLVDAASDLWITDFGLARLRTHAGLTMTGDTVGTLRYMSPEQALAKRALVDHRTDIYSLGLTVYEAVTLEPAYPGDDREEVLRRIALGEPPAPRRINPAVPFELETIILKAMAREPERRYATAQEMAEDLRRFLEYQPVRAARPTVSERLAKWAWRHRPVLAAASVVAALAALGLLAMTLLLWGEQRKTKAALDEAQANHERAETNFRKAVGGLNSVLWKLEDPRWAKIPGFRKARREITDRALQVFQEFVNESTSDPAIRFQAARAYEFMLSSYLVERRLKEADRAHGKAVALLEGLTAEYPEHTEYGLALGRVQFLMGNWDVSLKRPRQAREEYERAAQAYRRALPYDRDGKVHNNLAFLLCDCLEMELRDSARALALAKQAVELGPGQSAFWNTLGLAHYRAGEWRAARTALEKSMDLSGGGDANDWLILAMTAWRQGEEHKAREWYGKAASWLEKNPMTDELYHLRKEAAELMLMHISLMYISWP